MTSTGPDDGNEAASEPTAEVRGEDTARPTDSGVDDRTDAEREAAEFGGD
ncbi:hypothetical protein [Pseudonocardia nigra]|nr:hypothetical protein [Pseudonocardia nigra]